MADRQMTLAVGSQQYPICKGDDEDVMWDTFKTGLKELGVQDPTKESAVRVKVGPDFDKFVESTVAVLMKQAGKYVDGQNSRYVDGKGSCVVEAIASAPAGTGVTSTSRKSRDDIPQEYKVRILRKDTA